MANQKNNKENIKSESKNRRKIIPGIILTTLGIIFLLNNYGFAQIDIGRLWPLFLIIPGLFMLLGKSK
jgi:hypothetical protein